jgi:hypothetical protein
MGLCASASEVRAQAAVAAREAEPAPAGAFWTWLGKMPEPAASAGQRGEGLVVPDRFRAVAFDLARARAVLAGAPLERTEGEPVELVLPMPDGSVARVAVVESPVMAPDLAARYPGIRSYSGRGVDDPSISLRLDLTPIGLGAIIHTRGGVVRIDPYSRTEPSIGTTSWWRDTPRAPWSCEIADGDAGAAGPREPGGSGRYRARSEVRLRVFRLAVSTTGEYAQYHGGSVESALAAVAVTVNRVNAIFEADHAVRFVLAESSDQVVFLDPATDPFTNQSPLTDMVSNQGVLDSILGSEGYDVGHVFGTSGSGSAGGVGTACVEGLKAQGFSGISPPEGDSFAVDYVAHELGHQLGARHTFNNCRGTAGDDPSICPEPGSGSTVMSYAGLCGATNVQFSADPYFHAVNLDQVEDFVDQGAGSLCAAVIPQYGNQRPSVDAGPDWTIPQGTLFTLTASGFDPDGDTLFYAWEQLDGGPAAPFPLLDTGSGPLFRSLSPTSSPSRTFPRLEEVLEGPPGSVLLGEAYPTTDRTLNFRVTARDQRAGGGGTDADDATVSVTTQAGPFRVLTPAPGAVWSGTRVVTWDVAGTDRPPISTGTVSISLSVDGGQSFPIVLASGVANDGAHVVTIPEGLLSGIARVQVRADNSIYFDVSDGDFTLNPAAGSAVLVGTGAVAIDDTRANGNGNGRIDPGESAVAVSFQIANDGGSSAGDITATLESLVPTVRVIQDYGAYPALAAGQSGLPTAPFVIAVSSDHPCGEPIPVRIVLTSSAGGGLIEHDLSTGLVGGGGPAQTFSFGGASIAIPDNNAAGVTIPIAVSGLGGPGARVADVDFRLDGTACSSAPGATGVGISHTWVGDLVLTLTSPDGRQVRVINRPGGADPGSSGNNFCQTRLDDDGPWASIQNIPASGFGAPYVGSWLPAEPLSLFDGVVAEGTWTLRVQDLAQLDTGRVRAFSLIISAQSPASCEGPTSITCYADFNQDENEDLLDAQQLAQVVVGLVQPEPGWLDGDFNGDENVDLLDAQQLASFVIMGVCP